MYYKLWPPFDWSIIYFELFYDFPYEFFVSVNINLFHRAIFLSNKSNFGRNGFHFSCDGNYIRFDKNQRIV